MTAVLEYASHAVTLMRAGCAAYCTEPCEELTGDSLDDECGGCDRGPYGCNPQTIKQMGGPMGEPKGAGGPSGSTIGGPTLGQRAAAVSVSASGQVHASNALLVAALFALPSGPASLLVDCSGIDWLIGTVWKVGSHHFGSDGSHHFGSDRTDAAQLSTLNITDLPELSVRVEGLCSERLAAEANGGASHRQWMAMQPFNEGLAAKVGWMQPSAEQAGREWPECLAGDEAPPTVHERELTKGRHAASEYKV